MADKMRLDSAVLQAGHANSRSAAQAMIIAGEVAVNGQTVSKPSASVSETDEIQIKQKLKYVSRGGLKLEKAIEVFGLELAGKTCLDVGASTGGFTHCMLLNGAAKVYAVDVGYGQLDYSLRADERVVCMERYNARNLSPADIPPVGFASVDVSFISLKLVLPGMKSCMRPGAKAVALIKPQFEVGKGQVGKNGVVRDERLHKNVCTNIVEFCGNMGLVPMALDFSPIKGPKGNIEFLLLLANATEAANVNVNETTIDKVILESRNILDI